jgi:hypothetical protein
MIYAGEPTGADFLIGIIWQYSADIFKKKSIKNHCEKSISKIHTIIKSSF